MPNDVYLDALEGLRRHLDAAVRIGRELDATATAQIADAEPDRWGLLVDSLAAAMVPGEMGSVQQLLTALTAALDDR